ncbi:MAG TPA: hypothetical protein VFU32_00775 [Ktedonobacterales bacterium]|nr:hypothetical protein [Ktedonobacterales bacterium]
MGSDAQTFLDNLPASVALLRCEASRNFYHLMTSPRSLVRQDVDESSPGRIGNTLCQMMVLEHASNVQVFHTDMLVLLCVGFGRLEQEIPPLALDFEMRFGTIARRFASSYATFLAAAELTMLTPQGSLTLAIVPRIDNRCAVGIRQEDFQAHIQPNIRMKANPAIFLVAYLFWWFANNESIPVPIGAQNQMAGLRCSHQRSMQLDFEQQAQLARHTQMLTIFVQAKVFLVLAQLDTMPAIGGLEAWEAAGDIQFFTGEVPPERFIQPVSQHLDRCGRDAFPTTPGKAGGQFILEEKPARIGILLFGGSQHLVVQAPRVFQAGRQLVMLPLIHKETVFKRSHALIMALEQPYCQEQQGCISSLCLRQQSHMPNTW